MDSDSKKIFLSDIETASPYLPEEILIEIFSRLPSKSVGRFRCLSKSWRTQLSTTQFIKSHLSRKPQQKNIILHEKFQRGLNIMTLHNKDITCSIKIMFDGYTELWGSCNGLVLLVTDRVGMSVFNPTTLQRVYIPDSPLALDKNEFGTIYGFGYDSSSDDYKIVILSSYKDEMYEIVKFVDVYSLKRGVWNRVISSPYGHAYYDLLPGAFVNNAIHWLNASEESGVAIAAFDLANEVFYDVCGPTDARKEVFEAFDLVVLEGCLCMFTRFRATNVFWMLNEYGSVESWTKFSMPAEILICLFELKPLCFIGDEEEKLLVVSDTKSLVVCNLKEKTCEHMDTDESEFDTGGTFVESLVSPFLIASNDRINSVMEPI